MLSSTSARAAEQAAASGALHALGLSAGSLLDQISDAVIAIDDAQRVVYWGGGAREIYGLEPRQALCRPLTELYTHRWLSPDAEREAHEALAERGRWRGHNVHVLPSGEERFVDSTVTVLRDAAGARVGLLAVVRDETRRQRAEDQRELAAAARERAVEARIASERLLQGVADVAPCLLYVYDLVGGNNVWGNREILTTLGYSLTDLSAFGANLLTELLHPEDLARYAAHRRVLLDLRDGEVALFDYRMRSADGAFRWLSSREVVFRRGPDGKTRQIVGAATDVTEHRRVEDARRAAEQKVHDGEARAKAILEGLQEGFLAVDASWRLTYVNARAEVLMGRPAASMIDRVLWDVVPGLADSEFGRTYRRVAAEGRAEAVRASLGDSSRVYEARAYPLGDGLAIYVEEVTRLVERERREQRLARREATFRHTTSLIVWTTDPRGCAVEESPSWRAFTGQPHSSFEGFGWLGALHPEDRQAAQAAWSEAIARASVFECKYRVRRHDGVYVWTVARAAPVVDDDGTIVEWVGSNTEISAEIELLQRIELAGKEAERARAMYESLLDAIPIGVAFLDTGLRYQFINHALATANGVPAAAHLDRTVLEVLPDQNPELVSTLARVRDEGLTVAREITGFTPSAEGPRTWRVHFFPVRSAEALLGVGATVEDVTERVVAARELSSSARKARERAEELDTIMRAVPAAIWISRDRDCASIIGNPESYRVLRATEGTNVSATTQAEDALERTFVEYVNGVRAAPEDLSMQVAARTGVPVTDAEVTFEFSDGRFVHMFGSAAPLFTSTGEVRGAIAAFVDVTKMKEATQALARREEEVRALVDNLPELAWMAEPDGALSFYNRRWYEYTGTTPDEMRGWGWAKVHHPELLPSVTERWRHAVATGEPFEMEFSLRGADGVYRWFLTRARPIRGADGQITRWIGCNTDVDELRRLREEAARAASFAELFVAMIGHDLRTPLSAMIAGAQFVERLARGDDKVLRTTARIRSSGERMARMIDQILDFSRIRAGHGLPYAPKRVDLAALLARVRDELVLHGGRVELVCAGATAGRWDDDRLAQVFSNLVGNAIEHTSSPDPVQVRVDGRSPSTVRVEVQSAGTIPEDVLPKIFEPFRQGRVRARSSGLGLGLYITREIVALHRGTIQVTTGPLATTFTIELPRDG